MAKRSASAPPPKQPANLPTHAVPGAIRKLERRREEIQGAKISADAADSWTVAESLCSKLQATVAEIFGLDSLEAERLNVTASDFQYMVMVAYGEIPIGHKLQAFEEGRQLAMSRIDAELSILRERLEDSSEGTVARALLAYKGLELHRGIQDAAGQLFQDGHYAQAILEAVKALNSLVRYRSGLDHDGITLMERAFSPNNPILRFNDLADESDKEEQKGFMMMCSGAVAGLRNPRAHKLIKDDPERALEFIAFISLLAKLVDASIKGRPSP